MNNTEQLSLFQFVDFAVCRKRNTADDQQVSALHKRRCFFPVTQTINYYPHRKMVFPISHCYCLLFSSIIILYNTYYFLYYVIIYLRLIFPQGTLNAKTSERPLIINVYYRFMLYFPNIAIILKYDGSIVMLQQPESCLTCPVPFAKPWSA